MRRISASCQTFLESWKKATTGRQNARCTVYHDKKTGRRSPALLQPGNHRRLPVRVIDAALQSGWISVRESVSDNDCVLSVYGLTEAGRTAVRRSHRS